MNLSVNYLKQNMTGISALLFGYNNILWVWIWQCNLKYSYHSNTTMNFVLDDDLFWLPFVKSTTCFTELRKQAVKQFYLGTE